MDFMKLFQNFLKLSIAGNIRNYLKTAGAVIITVIILILSNNLISNIRFGNIIIQNNFKYSSIQMTLSILGGIFILNQYYRTMKMNIKNYSIIKALGASRNQMRLLIYLQSILLFLITVPVGTFTGISLSNILLKELADVAFRGFNYDIFDSSFEILIISGMISGSVLIFGIIIDIGVKRKLPSQISTE
jgi:ABC-type antimicrobial peptide transport system permease subunit